jgi:hypothetical protein
MERVRSAAALLVMLVLATACASPPTSEVPNAPAQRLHGSWRWIAAVDTRTGQFITPAAAGFDAELQFTAESDRSGTFTYRRIGQPDIHGVFSIWSEHAPGNDFITIEPTFDFVTRNAWVAVGRDSLFLGGVFELGRNSTWARAASP